VGGLNERGGRKTEDFDSGFSAAKERKKTHKKLSKNRGEGSFGEKESLGVFLYQPRCGDGKRERL